MSPNVILKTNILKKCEELLKDVTKQPKIAVTHPILELEPPDFAW